MSAWLQGLQSRADQGPLQARDALFAAGSTSAFGSIEPALAQRLVDAGLPIVHRRDGWDVVGASLNAALADIAQGLDVLGLAGAWRSELLGVSEAGGKRIGAIERAAVRPLGITTHAVHLVGWAEQGGVWVQQRAFDKATDPGMWDTLMGGLVSAGESIEDTLVRETWEEAGLHVEQLRDVAACGQLVVRRPVKSGYMVEHIHLHDATIPHASTPQNQDGEVAAFECLSIGDLHARLHDNAFTLEAALILAQLLALRKRG
jgi:8-oxo-dGTP pyrophosphatase MutT (NUDIX family)